MKKTIKIIVQIMLAIIIGAGFFRHPDMSIGLKVFNLFGMFCAGANISYTLNKTEE